VAVDLIERTKVQSPATTIGRRLKLFDAITNPRTRRSSGPDIDGENRNIYIYRTLLVRLPRRPLPTFCSYGPYFNIVIAEIKFVGTRSGPSRNLNSFMEILTCFIAFNQSAMDYILC
jgi:hypothetical protein